jgi:preprotein translocase subunit SecE
MKKPNPNQKITKMGYQEANQETKLPKGSRNPENGINAGKKEDKRKPNWAVSRKEHDKKAEEKIGYIKRSFSMAIQFLRESKMELKKVKWPMRKELFASTAVVIALVLVVALFLFLIDWGLTNIIKNIIG